MDDQSVFGVESAVEAGMRFEKALSELAKRHPAETTIGIATHGRVMTSFLQTKNLADPIKFWKSLTFPDLILIDWPSGDIVGRESFP